MTNTQAQIHELPKLRGGVPWLGNVLAFRRDPVGFLRAGRELLGDVFAFNLLGKQAALVSGPSGHRAVLGAKEEILSCHQAYSFMTPVFGEGVAFDAEPSVMEEQMHMILGPLTGKQLRSSAKVMAEEVDTYLQSWGELGERDLSTTMTELTIAISSRCLVGAEFRSKWADALPALYHDLEASVRLAGLINPSLPLPSFRRRDRAKALIESAIASVIAERRAEIGSVHTSSDERNDMLATLMTARYADGTPLSDDIIIGLLLTLIFAGHHTSAIMASWTGVLLLAHPEWYERVQAEQASFVAESPELSQANLRRMTVLDSCVKEAERMYPPLPFLMRVAVKEFVCAGYRIPPKTLVFVSPGVSHRHPDVFRDPDSYDPARFGPEREEDHRTPYGMISFGAGPHACVGEAFARQQIKIIWATLIRRYDLEALQPLNQPDNSGLLVGPAGPTRVRYRQRT